jgi:hypothetical protein
MDQPQTRTTALITGASSGIGYALAKVMARHGHNLVLVVRNQSKLHQLSDELAKNSISYSYTPNSNYNKSLYN